MAPETGKKMTKNNGVEIVWIFVKLKRNHCEEHCSIIHSTPYSSSL